MHIYFICGQLLIKRHAMKSCRVVELQLHAFLSPGQSGSLWLDLCPGKNTLYLLNRKMDVLQSQSGCWRKSVLSLNQDSYNCTDI
jgi:hypothetical protein